MLRERFVFPQACLRVTTQSNVSDVISPNSDSATLRMFMFMYFSMFNECFYRCLPVSDFECDVMTLCDVVRTEYKRPLTSFYHAAEGRARTASHADSSRLYRIFA